MLRIAVSFVKDPPHMPGEVLEISSFYLNNSCYHLLEHFSFKTNDSVMKMLQLAEYHINSVLKQENRFI